MLNPGWGATNYAAGSDGVFYQDSKMALKDITDGTSNTLMLGERAWELTRPTGNPVACAAGNLFAVNYHNGQLTIRNGLGGGAVGINDIVANNCLFGFSSLHKGGAQFVLADGSVRFLSENIDQKFTPAASAGAYIGSTYTRLLSRYDGEPVGEF